MGRLYRAEIRDDNGDMTYGPPESRSAAAQRVKDALTSSRNIDGKVKEVK